MNISKSIDFLLENAGPVIQYRLRKEILHNLKQTEEDKLLAQIYQTPYFRLLQTYVKPDGYIGSGAHSWDNWRGEVLHETPMQDGEAAARLLSYYAIPKTNPIVANFVAAMRDEDTLRKEFSYIPPEAERFNNRFRGINSGYCLIALMYTMQAMLGYGDDEYVLPFQNVALEAFRSIMPLSSLSEITKARQSKARYSYPYIEENTYFPGQYHLETLAYTSAWRTPDNINLMADALNHYNEFMPDGLSIHVKIGNKYIVPAPLNMQNRPIRPFRADLIESITYRRLLTEIAMLGVGERVGVIKESIANVESAISDDGILNMRFDLPHNKRYSPKSIEYPTAYADVRLEPDYKRKYALECDLTFWAVQFLYLCTKNRREPGMDSKELRQNLREFYNREAENRDARGDNRAGWKKEQRDLFVSLIQQEGKKTLLELGPGPGVDSKAFMEAGLTVTAIDLSAEMVRICKEKGIDAYEMDFYDLPRLGKKFDSIWSMNSLLHVPKPELIQVLQGIAAVMNEDGLLFMGVYGGEDTESEWMPDGFDAPRFFAFYGKEALTKVLEQVFDIVSFEEINPERSKNGKDMVFQSIFLRKR